MQYDTSADLGGGGGVVVYPSPDDVFGQILDDIFGGGRRNNRRRGGGSGGGYPRGGRGRMPNDYQLANEFLRDLATIQAAGNITRTACKI